MRIQTAKKLFAVLVPLAVTFSVIFTSTVRLEWQCSANESGALFCGPASYPKPLLVLNRITGALVSPDLDKKLPVDPETSQNREKKRLSGLLLYTISVLSSSSNEAGYMLLLSLAAVIAVKLKRTDFPEKRDSPPPGFRHYIWWSLGFLTPLDKSKENLAEKYSLLPFSIYGTAAAGALNETRTLFTVKRSAGFLLSYGKI